MRRKTAGEYVAGKIARRKAKAKAVEAISIPLWKGKWRWFVLWVAYRLFAAFFTRTEFVPDEAWQTTEVAHVLAFGEGHLTWEWRVGLRNHLYPLIFTGLYKVMAFFDLDTPYTLVMGPRIIQAVLTAIGDYSLYLYSVARYGELTAGYIMGCFAFNWFNFYCGSRTLTNTVEMTLNCVALLALHHKRLISFGSVVTLNFIIRPTSLLFWILETKPFLQKLFGPRDSVLIAKFLFCSGVTALGGVFIDTWMMGRPTIAALRFLKFNAGESDQFGSHPFLWYLYSGVPSVLVPHLLVLLISWNPNSARRNKRSFLTVLCFVGVFSFIAHKEIRFLLPILPTLMIITGDFISYWKHIYFGVLRDADYRLYASSRQTFNTLLWAGVATNVLCAVYLCGFHQGGMWPTSQYVADAAREVTNPRIWIYMPCYPFPVYTYFHKTNATIEMMTCGPSELNNKTLFTDYELRNHKKYSEEEPKIDEWVEATLHRSRAASSYPMSSFSGLPHFVMSFSATTNPLRNVLKRQTGLDYIPCTHRVHAHFGEDSGWVWVLCHPALFPSTDSYYKMYTPNPPEKSPDPTN